ncbi:MAG: cytochrome C oxidase subunit IV family protein [Acidobacteriota bacterium]
MSEHVVRPTTYCAIFALLLLFTVVTASVAFVDLGPLNTFVALTIAVVKATLVVLYFMHLRYSARLTWIFVGAGVFWFLILMAFLFADIYSRGWFPPGVDWNTSG